MAINKDGDSANLNETVIAQSFDVSAASNSAAKGTIFAKEDGTIQVVAFVEIDADDWGGVAIYVPDGWRIENIASSFPESELGKINSENVNVWITEGNKWQAMVEIGRARNYVQTTGGSGTVVIDLHPTSNSQSTSILIEVGSSDENGIKTMGTDFVEVPISFK